MVSVPRLQFEMKFFNSTFTVLLLVVGNLGLQAVKSKIIKRKFKNFRYPKVLINCLDAGGVIMNNGIKKINPKN